MPSFFRGIWRSLVPLCLFFASVFAPAGCTCVPKDQSVVRRYIACQSKHDRRPTAPPLGSKIIAPGAIPASFAVTDSGDAGLSMPLVVPPGRAGVEPPVALVQ